MGRRKKVDIEREIAEKAALKDNVTGHKVVIFSNNNLRLGHYWIDGGKHRELHIDEFNKHKETCQELEEGLKNGSIKIEYR